MPMTLGLGLWLGGAGSGAGVAAQNLILQSEAMGTAPWTTFINGTGVLPSVTNDASVGPNGSAATLITVNRTTTTNADFSLVYQPFSLAGGAYSSALWVIASTGADVGKQIVFYVQDGVTAARTETIITLTASYQQISILNTTLSASASTQFGFGYLADDTLTNGATSFYATMAQVCLGATLKPYAKTTGAAVP